MARGLRRESSTPRILSAYIAREFLLSFLVAFLFFFVVFFVNQLLLMAEEVLSRRAPLADVLLLMLYAVPSEIAMSFPFASLVGALMAAGRLSSDNELLVMQAAGLSFRRIFVPFLVLGLAFTMMSFAMNDILLPLGSIQYGKLYRSLVVSSPAVELKPWSSRRYGDVTIVTGEVSGSTVADLIIFDRMGDGRTRVISAKKASLDAPDAGGIRLRLEKVWIQTLVAKDRDRVEYSEAVSMEYRLDLSRTGTGQTILGPYEMSSRDLWRSISEKERIYGEKTASRDRSLQSARAELAAVYEGTVAARLPWPNAQSRVGPHLESLREQERNRPSDRNLQLYRLEYYKKFAIPSGAAFFVFLAFPLGIRARRSGRSVGFGLGLLVAVVYWAFLLGGQTLGTRLGFSPFWSMWGGNVFVAACAAVLWLQDRIRG